MNKTRELWYVVQVCRSSFSNAIVPFLKTKTKMKAIKSIWKEIKIKRFSFIDLVWIAFIVIILKYYGL